MSDEAERKSDTGAQAARRCWVYKGARRGELYLYLAEEEGFDAAPKALIEELGTLRLVMELELHPGRKLARANVLEVIQALDRNGYYLQLPPAKMPGRHRLQ